MEADASLAREKVFHVVSKIGTEQVKTLPTYFPIAQYLRTNQLTSMPCYAYLDLDWKMPHVSQFRTKLQPFSSPSYL